MIASLFTRQRHRLGRALLLLCLLSAVAPASAQGRKSRTLQRLEQERKQLLRNIEASDKKLQQLRRDTRSQEQTLRAVKEQVEQRRQVVAVLGSEVSGLQARRAYRSAPPSGGSSTPSLSGSSATAPEDRHPYRPARLRTLLSDAL